MTTLAPLSAPYFLLISSGIENDWVWEHKGRPCSLGAVSGFSWKVMTFFFGKCSASLHPTTGFWRLEGVLITVQSKKRKKWKTAEVRQRIYNPVSQSTNRWGQLKPLVYNVSYPPNCRRFSKFQLWTFFRDWLEGVCVVCRVSYKDTFPYLRAKAVP